MKKFVNGIKRTDYTTSMRVLWTVTCDIGYILAMLVWVPIIPFALLLHAVTEIKAALQSDRVVENSAQPVIEIGYTSR